jgi:hypothetical protein
MAAPGMASGSTAAMQVDRWQLIKQAAAPGKRRGRWRHQEWRAGARRPCSGPLVANQASGGTREAQGGWRRTRSSWAGGGTGNGEREHGGRAGGPLAANQASGGTREAQGGWRRTRSSWAGGGTGNGERERGGHAGGPLAANQASGGTREAQGQVAVHAKQLGGWRHQEWRAGARAAGWGRGRITTSSGNCRRVDAVGTADARDRLHTHRSTGGSAVSHSRYPPKSVGSGNGGEQQ